MDCPTSKGRNCCYYDDVSDRWRICGTGFAYVKYKFCIKLYHINAPTAGKKGTVSDIAKKKNSQSLTIDIRARITLKVGKKYKKTCIIKPGKTLSLKKELNNMLKKSSKKKRNLKK